MFKKEPMSALRSEASGKLYTITFFLFFRSASSSMMLRAELDGDATEQFMADFTQV